MYYVSEHSQETISKKSPFKPLKIEARCPQRRTTVAVRFSGTSGPSLQSDHYSPISPASYIDKLQAHYLPKQGMVTFTPQHL